MGETNWAAAGDQVKNPRHLPGDVPDISKLPEINREFFFKHGTHLMVSV